MSQLVVFIAGLLLVAESQASDVADRSTLQGFLPKYMPSGSDASRSSMSAYDKFITPNFKSAKHGPVTDNIQGAIPSAVVDDKPLLHATAQKQDPLSLSAIGVGLLSLVTMLGVHLRRRMQPASVIASSSGLTLDMPMNTASAVGDNVMEMQPKILTR